MGRGKSEPASAAGAREGAGPGRGGGGPGRRRRGAGRAGGGSGRAAGAVEGWGRAAGEGGAVLGGASARAGGREGAPADPRGTRPQASAAAPSSQSQARTRAGARSAPGTRETPQAPHRAPLGSTRWSCEDPATPGVGLHLGTFIYYHLLQVNKHAVTQSGRRLG